MSSIFSLTDKTFSLIADLVHKEEGRLPTITMRFSWTSNTIWEMNLPVNYTSIQIARGEFEKRWVVEKGVDNSIHVKIEGTKFSDQSHGIHYHYRPSAVLQARDLNTLIQLIRTSNFKIDIKNDQQELLETGNFSADDVRAVRCAI